MTRFPRPRPKMDPYIGTARSIAPVARDYFLPLPLEGIRVVFATDFHLRPSMDPDALLRPIADLKPDLLLLGGDYADRRDQALRLFDAMRALRPPLGIIGVLGNNDREAFDRPRDVARAMERFGGHLLVNESVSVAGLTIGGVDEYKRGSPRYKGLFPEGARNTVLLSHYPLLPEAPEDTWPDVMLSGHTHGGQFNLFGLTPYSVFFEFRRFRPALISGTARFHRTTLLVSKGIGTSRLPLRVGAEPEICLLQRATS